MVSPATLVPRPETEILVDRVLSEIPGKAEWRILDLGTGSGTVASDIDGLVETVNSPGSERVHTR